MNDFNDLIEKKKTAIKTICCIHIYIMFIISQLLTICSLVISNNLGPNIAGAKNRKKINPLITEYLTSLFFGK